MILSASGVPDGFMTMHCVDSKIGMFGFQSNYLLSINKEKGNKMYK